MPDQPKILKEYAPAQIERIMAILDRASDGRQIDSEAVKQSLLEIIYAIGLATDGSEQSRLWQEFSSQEPSHRTERDGFLRLAGADDPLALARRDSRLSSLLRSSFGLHRAGGRWRKAGHSWRAPLRTWRPLTAG